MTSDGVPAADGQRTLLRGVELWVRVGLHPWERHPERPNRLLVDVDLHSAVTVGTGAYVDYDRVRRRLLTWSGREHVELLETLVAELLEVCFEDPLVTAARVRVMKPDIFPEAAGAGVEVFQRRPGGTGA